MASFGRRPAKGASTSGNSNASRNGASTKSESFQRLMEEEAERERFAKEFEQRKHEPDDEEDGKREDKAKCDDSVEKEAKPNPQVFFEVEVRGPELLGRSGKIEGSGRLEFELFADVVPKTAENFRCLCTGERGSSLHFERSMFHRIIPGFMAQGGDITDGDGTGGRSIYGRTFQDENFTKRHDAPGTLSMANSGKHTNNSQFFILFKPQSHLDGKHVVFGRLLRDSDKLLRRMEERGTKGGDVKGTVKITKSGEIAVSNDRKKAARRSRTRSRSRRQKKEQRSRSRSRCRSRSAREKKGKRSRSRSRSGGEKNGRRRSSSS